MMNWSSLVWCGSMQRKPYSLICSSVSSCCTSLSLSPSLLPNTQKKTRAAVSALGMLSMVSLSPSVSLLRVNLIMGGTRAVANKRVFTSTKSAASFNIFLLVSRFHKKPDTVTVVPLLDLFTPSLPTPPSSHKLRSCMSSLPGFQKIFFVRHQNYFI